MQTDKLRGHGGLRDNCQYFWEVCDLNVLPKNSLEGIPSPCLLVLGDVEERTQSI